MEFSDDAVTACESSDTTLKIMMMKKKKKKMMMMIIMFYCMTVKSSQPSPKLIGYYC